MVLDYIKNPLIYISVGGLNGPSTPTLTWGLERGSIYKLNFLRQNSVSPSLNKDDDDSCIINEKVTAPG